MLANTLHILMEFCEGGSLQQVLSRRERNEESFDEEEVFDWFIQIAKALMHVHESKILHRDLKTSNVFLTKRNIVKLGDFGIARQMDDTSDFAQARPRPDLRSSRPIALVHEPSPPRADVRGHAVLSLARADRGAAVQPALRRVGAGRRALPDDLLPLPLYAEP